jgi:hypothetical protein
VQESGTLGGAITVTGDYAVSQSVVTLSSSNRSGGDSSTTYSQGASDSSTTTTQETGNALTGDQSRTTTQSSTASVQESGTYQPSGVNYSLEQTGSASSTLQQNLNSYSGADSLSLQSGSQTSLTVSDSNSSGSYQQQVLSTQGWVWRQSGNDLTGDYSGSGLAVKVNNEQAIDEQESSPGRQCVYSEQDTVGYSVTECQQESETDPPPGMRI